MMHSAFYHIWLATRRGVSPKRRVDLIKLFGSPKGVWEAEEDGLRAHNLPEQCMQSLLRKECDGAQVEAILARCEREQIHILCRGEKGYPPNLERIEDEPVVLYARGKLCSWHEPAAAVIGTRQPSEQGLGIACEIGSALAKNNIVTVSGMAFGIDGAAHQGALNEDGKTVAVLACGVNRCYPRDHYALMEQILDTGMVLSEQPPDTGVQVMTLQMRNRIITGLCEATVVVEVGEGNGSKGAAEYARKQKRPLYTIQTLKNPQSWVQDWVQKQRITPVCDVWELVNAVHQTYM